MINSMRAPQGYGVANKAGRELLSFLSAHQATLCNSWFEKKAIHVAARRGALCNTDHHIMCAKLKLQRARYGRRISGGAKGKKYDMEKLRQR